MNGLTSARRWDDRIVQVSSGSATYPGYDLSVQVLRFKMANSRRLYVHASRGLRDGSGIPKRYRPHSGRLNPMLTCQVPK